MLKRVITAIVGIPILLYIVFAGDWVFAVAICALAILGVFEYSRMIKAKNLKFCPTIYAFPFVYVYLLYIGNSQLATQAIIGLVLFVLARQLMHYPQFDMMSLGASLAAGLYPTLLLGNLLLLRLEAGIGLTLHTMLCIMAYDTAAYFIGVKYGKRRPWPLISPKKSIEGSLGGFVGSLAVAFAATHFLSLSVWQALLIGIGTGIVGQAGDLAESALKRYAGLKDSGALLPGHGGVLDRFDSLMFAATFVYWLWLTTILR